MKKILFIAAMTALLCSCALIVHGSKQSITFNSTPTNATILDNGVELGKTPLVAKLDRKTEHQISIQLAGYKPFDITLEKSVDWGWGIVGNIFSWDIIGIVVDYVTGAIYKLTPDTVNASLGGNVALVPQDGSLLIAVTMSPDPSWEKVGQLELN